jgi:hypothetical protein
VVIQAGVVPARFRVAEDEQGVSSHVANDCCARGGGFPQGSYVVLIRARVSFAARFGL